MDFKHTNIVMYVVAIGGSVITAVQSVISMIAGAAVCFNNGCRIVEGLTTVPPIVINIAGFLFFQGVLWSLVFLKRQPFYRLDITGLLLLCGLAFDSALVAYQLFVVQVLCSYCLLIFGLVLILNLLYDRKQMVAGVATFAAIMISFSLLTFSSAGAQTQTFSLKSAAYGLKSCSSPAKEVHLIFSSQCPHCREVLELLKECNSCDLYLNPIEDVRLAPMEGLELLERFSPEVNRLILSVLGIDSVPVLVVKSDEGYRFIKGEDNIVNYILEACFTYEEVTYFDQTSDSNSGQFSVLTEDHGECTVDIACDQP